MTGLFVINLFADEGMWIPSLLEKYNYEDMRQKGLRISAEDIYSINNTSLKDAVVLFGRGCTGGVVSETGLLLTNHHCGYGQIQSHSSIEHDYLTDGFWAMSHEEELPNPGLIVSFLVSMEDVTERVLKGVRPKLNEKERMEIIRRNSDSIVAEVTAENHYEAQVKPLFQGNQYFVYVMEIFRDVRLVGAPPSSIGKFGGDTDNWMWPRHTGDFSVFRIYADTNNMPADYSEDNVPYTPKNHFNISLRGVERGDFSWVYGYPYTTNEYLPSFMIEFVVGKQYPERIKIRQKKLDIIGSSMEADPEVRIQYSSKYARISNAWKKWIGVIRGLRRLDAVNIKISREKDFNSWAVNNDEGARYRTLLEDYRAVITEMEEPVFWADYYYEAIYSTDIFNFAARFRNLAGLSKDEQDEIEKEIESLKNATAGFFKNYHQPTDMELFSNMMRMFFEGVDNTYHPGIFDYTGSKFKNDFDAYTRWVYKNTIFDDESQVLDMLDNYSPSMSKKILQDPVYKAFISFYDYYSDNISGKISSLRPKMDSLQRRYMAGLMTAKPDRLYYSDANATLRIAYGFVNDYNPQDAVHYKHYTTLQGIIEKDNPDIYDYDVPDRLTDLYNSKDYGRYAREDGAMPVCFTAMNHTTGGNSGSPVLNAEGQLVGLNFDRNWEGTMSDFMYDPYVCRNITLDIRYCLFIIDKFAGAGHLVEEMTLIE